MTTVLFMGGNGHSTARLARVRAVLARDRAFELHEVRYPGFEGRAHVTPFEAFLDSVRDDVERLNPPDQPPAWIHATGIGGLLALTLRARGELLRQPIMMQAPVLWGLEQRRFPVVMRNFPPARLALRGLFNFGPFQRRFARKQFETAVDDATLQGFFQGYNQCAAMGDFFSWLTPALLRRLEARFAQDPQALRHILILWGGKDAVVSLEELHVSEAALQHTFARRVIDDWGHYPMIDAPERWVGAVAEVLQDHARGQLGPDFEGRT